MNSPVGNFDVVDIANGVDEDKTLEFSRKVSIIPDDRGRSFKSTITKNTITLVNGLGIKGSILFVCETIFTDIVLSERLQIESFGISGIIFVKRDDVILNLVHDSRNFDLVMMVRCDDGSSDYATQARNDDPEEGSEKETPASVFNPLEEFDVVIDNMINDSNEIA